MSVCFSVSSWLYLCLSTFLSSCLHIYILSASLLLPVFTEVCLSFSVMFIFPDAAAEGDSKEESDKANRCEEEEEEKEEKSEKEESGEEEAEKEKSGEEESGEEEEEKKTKESEQGGPFLPFLIYYIKAYLTQSGSLSFILRGTRLYLFPDFPSTGIYSLTAGKIYL
jgi:hypothetical protein